MAAIIRGGAQGLSPMSITINISAIMKTAPPIRPASTASVQNARVRTVSDVT
jgi:hypothetical protein